MKSKFPFYKQESMFDCALASVQMILKYYGGNINKIKLSELLKITKKGTSAYNIVQTLKFLGFSVKGVKTDINNIKVPSIAHVRQGYLNHFVVIYEIDYQKKELLIADPATRIKKYSFEEFEKIWTNVLIMCIPNKKITNEKNINTFKFLFGFVKLFRKKFFLIGVFSFFSIIISLILSFSLQVFLYSEINFLLPFIFLAFFKMFLDYIRNHLLLNVSESIDYKICFDSLMKILNLPYSYYQGKTSGEMAYKIHDLENVKKLIEIGIIFVFVDFPLMFTSTIFLILINYKLFLILVFFLLILVFISLKYHFKLNLNIEKYKVYHTNFYQKITEKFEAFETIKGLGAEKVIFDKLMDKKRDVRVSALSLGKCENKLIVLKDFVSTLSYLFVICFGLYFVSNNMITLGNFMTFIILSSYLKNPIIKLLNLDFEISSSIYSLKKIMELISFENKKYLTYDDKISFRNVSFSFDNFHNTIKNISFDMLKNEKILITGKSGCGKSTLLKLIMGYYKPSKGDIKVIKRCIYISQNERLFTGTLNDNLKIFNDSDLSKIISITNLDEVINKSNLKLNQLIFENGFNLSGGQKQRIFLSRSLMKKFDVLLIDEGLNQLDISLERRILKSLFKNYKDKLIIVVSHRLDNIDLFERVIKLDDGEIIFDEKNVKEIVYGNFKK